MTESTGDERTVTVRMPARLHEGLERLKWETKRSMNTIAKQAIEQAILENPVVREWFREAAEPGGK